MVICKISPEDNIHGIDETKETREKRIEWEKKRIESECDKYTARVAYAMKMMNGEKYWHQQIKFNLTKLKNCDWNVKKVSSALKKLSEAIDGGNPNHQMIKEIQDSVKECFDNMDKISSELFQELISLSNAYYEVLDPFEWGIDIFDYLNKCDMTDDIVYRTILAWRSEALKWINIEETKLKKISKKAFNDLKNGLISDNLQSLVDSKLVVNPMYYGGQILIYVMDCAKFTDRDKKDLFRTCIKKGMYIPTDDDYDYDILPKNSLDQECADILNFDKLMRCLKEGLFAEKSINKETFDEILKYGIQIPKNMYKYFKFNVDENNFDVVNTRSVENEWFKKENLGTLNLSDDEKHVIQLLDSYVNQARSVFQDTHHLMNVIKEDLNRLPEISKPLVEKMCDLIVSEENEDIIKNMIKLIGENYDKFSDDGEEYFIWHRHELYQIAKYYDESDERNQWFS